MLLLIIFAFLGGIVTILSPCILPVLPIVLSGTLTGGKKRPLGVVTGFILSFTFFTLFLTTLVKATGVSADVLRTISVVVIALFGLGLIVPSFQIFLEGIFSKLIGVIQKLDSRLRGNDKNTNKQNDSPDFLAGFFIGLSLGLVWTPCVGPILASIITLAATSSVSGGAILITLAYSLGTAIPLFAITYGGKQLLTNHPWLQSRARSIQKAFGVLMLVAALATYMSWDRQFQVFILGKFPSYGSGLTKIEDNQFVKNALDAFKKSPGKLMLDMFDTDYGPAPEFIAGGEWFNTEPLTMESLSGKVVLIDIWTYTCINCIRTLPYVKSWWKKYQDKGLVIVGVHAPEFEFEKSSKNVAKAIKDFGITYPVMQDNDFATWQAYNNNYWPAHYLIDKNGKIREKHIGEGDYDDTEKFIQKLLAETGVTDVPAVNNPTYQVKARTPETYLGYQRTSGFVSPEILRKDRQSIYSLPKTIPYNSYALSGSWVIGDKYSMPTKGATLVHSFDAAEVYLVMRPKGEGASGGIRVYLDDVPVPEKFAGEDVINGNVKVTEDRLYKLIKLPTPGPHILKIEVLDDDVEFYAFTFG